MPEIKISCTGATHIDYTELVPFQGNLKELSKANYAKLRKEILELGFSEPISVWKNDGKYYVLNGHQRLRTIRELVESEHYTCPPLPVNLVEASDIKEAKKKILALTSQYGKITDQGLYEFLNESSIDITEAEESFSFPEIDFKDFKDEYFDGITRPETNDNTIIDEPLNQCPNCGFLLK